MRSTTRRAFWGVTRTYRALALAVPLASIAYPLLVSVMTCPCAAG